jgi:hypothetical protein
LKINEPEGGRVDAPVSAQAPVSSSASESSKSVEDALEDLKGI